jgi:hypothetical protein
VQLLGGECFQIFASDQGVSAYPGADRAFGRGPTGEYANCTICDWIRGLLAGFLAGRPNPKGEFAVEV